MKASLETITRQHHQSFLKRAREYMLAYDALAKWKENGDNHESSPLVEKSAYLLNKVVSIQKNPIGLSPMILSWSTR